ncbi:hypothetical protein AQS8620_00351 [Aquimixticola soesokkakensis]|uniref:Lipoprotein n=1 Tax=Aquimixticola soesokkakensis TaxID=1519096 RepID=A0A1Y5RGE8_9RHOB|nr:hypothetical protein [Aquimixticola soesokkakensis]SLN16897.1 hypothetical protein AQS8620_00351 [Aquimixticola soesokkakensis]
MSRSLSITVILGLLASLAGCAATTPSVSMITAAPVLRVVEGDRFQVYVDAARERAEAHRTNVVFPPPSKFEVLQHGAIAIREATGCAIAEGGLQGDQAIIKARLDCP